MNRELLKFLNGAEVEQVDEPLWEPSALVVFELEAYPEPKSLDQADLCALYGRYGSFHRVAKHIGTSEAFARLNAKSHLRKVKKKKRSPASKN
jgi:hypothetical protein